MFSSTDPSSSILFLDQMQSANDQEEDQGIPPRPKWHSTRANKVEYSHEEDVSKSIQYLGRWKIAPLSQANKYIGLEDDYGLVLSDDASFYALSALLPNGPAYFDGKKPFIFQYEVKIGDWLDCGGAYIKLLAPNSEEAAPYFWTDRFNDQSIYSIMFGPDRCGSSTDKVHFIFQHRNPLTGKLEQKHLKNPPVTKATQLTTLYTLIVQPDCSFEIRINNEIVRSGSLLVDFDPPVNPPGTIDDPLDAKPDDWVEDELIPDPTAIKPIEYDKASTEPLVIPDPKATKPPGWLDDQEPFIDDTSAQKPEDWDDNVSGPWEMPLIENPACQRAPGCGEWRPPLIKNPAYREPWKPPMIPNPHFRGVWRPRQIPNPGYYQDLKPNRFLPIAAVGIELWTMQSGIWFDNIFLCQDVQVWKQFTSETWERKHAAEQASLEKVLLAESETYPAIEEAQETDSADVDSNWLSCKTDKLLVQLTGLYQKLGGDRLLHHLEEFSNLFKNEPFEAFYQYPFLMLNAALITLTLAILIRRMVVKVFIGGERKDRKNIPVYTKLKADATAESAQVIKSRRASDIGEFASANKAMDCQPSDKDEQSIPLRLPQISRSRMSSVISVSRDNDQSRSSTMSRAASVSKDDDNI